MKVFTDTNYREHGAGDLVEYIEKEDGLRNRLGERMDDAEIEAFVEQSEMYDFEREIVIAPSNGDRLSNAELSRYTRRVMSDLCTDRPSATYCYAIHRDTDHPHTHVAVTGTKRDLWMDREDCLELRELATERFHEHHRELTAELDQAVAAELDVDLSQERAPELEPELDSEPDPEPAPESGSEPEPQPEPALEPEQDLDPGGERGPQP